MESHHPQCIVSFSLNHAASMFFDFFFSLSLFELVMHSTVYSIDCGKCWNCKFGFSMLFHTHSTCDPKNKKSNAISWRVFRWNVIFCMLSQIIPRNNYHEPYIRRCTYIYLCMFYYFIELSSLEYGTIDRLLHTLNEFELLNFTITLLICEMS